MKYTNLHHLFMTIHWVEMHLSLFSTEYHLYSRDTCINSHHIISVHCQLQPTAVRLIEHEWRKAGHFPQRNIMHINLFTVRKGICSWQTINVTMLLNIWLFRGYRGTHWRNFKNIKLYHGHVEVKTNCIIPID